MAGRVRDVLSNDSNGTDAGKDQPTLRIEDSEKFDIQEAGSEYHGNAKLFLQTHLHLIDTGDGQENQDNIANHIAEAVCILNIVTLRVADSLWIQSLSHIP